MDEDNKPNLLDLFRTMLDDHLGKEEFTKAFAKVVESIKQLKSENADEFKLLRETVDLLGKKLSDDNSADLSTFKGEAKAFLDSELAKALASIQQTTTKAEERIAEVKDGEQGPQGEPGPQGPAGSPDTAEDIRNKLELLEGDDRLRIEAIRDLSETLEKLKKGASTHVIATATALWNLSDVDVAGISVGQSLKWDGVRWIPFTPTTANTAVYGEAPTDSGDHIEFTLAHTPVSGTLRLYRGGAYQQAGSDYTLTDDTIALSIALADGEILLCDYEYA